MNKQTYRNVQKFCYKKYSGGISMLSLMSESGMCGIFMCSDSWNIPVNVIWQAQILETSDGMWGISMCSDSWNISANVNDGLSFLKHASTGYLTGQDHIL